MSRAPFPWDDVMGFGLGILRLTPGDFWRMTPRELVAAMGPFGLTGAGIQRADMAALMARFPDKITR